MKTCEIPQNWKTKWKCMHSLIPCLLNPSQPHDLEIEAKISKQLLGPGQIPSRLTCMTFVVAESLIHKLAV